MAFTDFQSVPQFSARYGVTALVRPFLPELDETPPPDFLLKQLEFARSRHKTAPNEQYMREQFISPVLTAALREYDWLNIWINEFDLRYDDTLNGFPDYLLTSLPRPCAIDTAGQKPFVAAVEAKKENFTEGWGQCLAEMYACALLNGAPETPVWGIVTTGETWQFGKMENGEFTRHNASFDLDPLGRLLAVLHHIFSQCDAQARKAAGET